MLLKNTLVQLKLSHAYATAAFSLVFVTLLLEIKMSLVFPFYTVPVCAYSRLLNFLEGA